MKTILYFAIFVTFGITFLIPQNTFAHCDGIDGPVVAAAKKALQSGNVNYVLVWVQEKDVENVTHIFNHTRKVRNLNQDAQKLADRFFFETLVRVHRAGEGAPYTGLKPAGRDLGPVIPAADKAIETATAKDLLNLINDEIHSGLHKRFMKAIELKNYDKNDVKAGQEYVAAYVNFFHYAEGIYNATQKDPHGHEKNTNMNLINHDQH